jgi:DNA helicase IV
MPTQADVRAEQDYLEYARAQLARMRDRTAALDIQGGDAIAAERLAHTLWQRARALADDGHSALFFGRLDLAATHPLARDTPRLYVGRRHIGDESGDPVVIDWRAEVAATYYRASHARPLDVAVRHRFGVEHGRITAIEEERLDNPAEEDLTSDILAAEIERPRVGPMRDIVSTIQPEQDELVRADATTTVAVQGAPGTGKTAVGLHRAAWLLYAHADRLARGGVLVIGPNRAFLDHIGAVLPALGEVDVRHTTVADLVGAEAGIRVRGTDSIACARVKGDARMAEVLRRAVWGHIRPPVETLKVPRGVMVWRVPRADAAEAIESLAGRGVRYAAGRDLLPQRLAHLVLLKMEMAGLMTDDRDQDAVARSAAVRAYANACWPAVKAPAVLHGLLADPARLAAAAEGILDPAEQTLLRWEKPPASPGAARWSPADAVLLDELADLLNRTPSVGHVILDEAQDLSPMQLRAVGRRCTTGAATVLGDLAQGTTPWATTSWAETLAHLGKPDGHVEELTRGFRVPAAVIAYAARLLPLMAPGLAAPRSVRSAAGQLEVRRVAGDPLKALGPAVLGAAATPGSVGVIVPDADLRRAAKALTAAGIDHGVLGAEHGDVEHRVDLVPATVAKGLEFDAVVVVEPAAIAAAEPDERTGLRRLYVVLTRAVSHLIVLHSQDLPDPLG